MLEVTTYSELFTLSRVWANGGYGLLVVVGRPGVGKSRTVRQAIEQAEEEYLWLKGSLSGFHMYQDLFKFKDLGQRIVIDDVDGCFKNENLVRLLKCLCETEPKKVLAWRTRAIESTDVPAEFELDGTTTCIIGNEFGRINANLGALVDRGTALEFNPSPVEVLGQAKVWFPDQEILGWIGARINLLPNLSFRDFLRSQENKKADLNWREMFLRETKIRDAEVILEELLKQKFENQEARIKEFENRTGLKRGMFFIKKKKIESRGNVQVD